MKYNAPVRTDIFILTDYGSVVTLNICFSTFIGMFQNK